jgi:hypothetical protein
MFTKYWDLYVLYLERCKTENYINDIDPNHYRMEWNHFWPKSIFGDWPVGQFLTLRQHAIASALQTLVFKEKCMCGWHKDYLPPNLLALAWPYFCEASRKTSSICHAKKDKNGKSLHGKRCAAIIHANKNKDGKSLLGLANGDANRINKIKDADGKSLNAVKGAAVVNSQVWQSTVDGFTSNAGAVAYHNKANGWPKDARVRIA